MTDDLTVLMDQALEGDAKAAELFYLRFLDAPLFVVERFQKEPLANLPSYPDPFLNLMAIQDSDRIIVPVFTSGELASEWAERELSLRSITGTELVALIPEEWWLALNPGSDINKEFSPWEIAELKSGKESIAEIVHELGLGIVQEFEVSQIGPDEHTTLKQALTNDAKSELRIEALYMLKEIGTDSEGREVTILLVGAAIEADLPAELEAIHTRIQKLADKTQIGAERVRVYSGRSLATVSLGMFKESAPFYQRK